jgi:hypothetical protein
VDRQLLADNGYSTEVLRELPSFVEALVRKEADVSLMQWAHDSAYRFFPLVEDETFGLTLHRFDLATNKVLAMAGRVEARDWVDVINCHHGIQNVGYLLWAACGKDPGFSPTSLLAQARRSCRYSATEISRLTFEGPPPDASSLGRQWHEMMDEAKEIIDLLPGDQAGMCVMDSQGELFRGGPKTLADALREDGLRFHAGSIKGALPKMGA